MRHRRGRALRRRYGRASSHPLFPRLVMYLNKYSPTSVVVSAKLQPHYGAAWKEIERTSFHSVSGARARYHALADEWAKRHGVPSDHIEYGY